MPQARWTKKSGGDTFEAGGGKFRGFRRSVGEVCGGELHFPKTLGQLRVRLISRGHFARQITGGGSAHAKRENGFASDAIQQEGIGILGGDRDDIHPFALAGYGCEIGWSRNIPIPKIVGNFLEMPKALAGARIQCYEAIRKEIIAEMSNAYEIWLWPTRGNISNPTYLIHGHSTPAICAIIFR